MQVCLPTVMLSFERHSNWISLIALGDFTQSDISLNDEHNIDYDAFYNMVQKTLPHKASGTKAHSGGKW